MKFCKQKSKSKHYNTQIKECAGNQAHLFKITDSLLRKSSSVLPQHDNLQELVNPFNDFFVTEISSLRSQLDKCKVTAFTHPPFTGMCLTQFEPATNDEIYQIIARSSKSTCAFKSFSYHAIV